MPLNIFDIIGPVMIGPSSSHTAGAVRIGEISAEILGEPPVFARICLSGSFAETHKGHRTDKALVAGLLGMKPDDERIRNSFEEAKKAGLKFEFVRANIPKAHPNTAKITLTGASGKKCVVQGASIGGGNILITQVNDMETSFSGTNNTLIIAHTDKPGMIASVTSFLSAENINIGNFRLNRPKKNYEAVMIIEVDGAIDKSTVEELKHFSDISSVVYLHAIESI